MGLFGKSKTPQEQVREWTKNISGEQRKITRQIRDIERNEAKVKASVKQAAKKGQIDVCKILAKELVQSKKTTAKLHKTNAELNSMSMKMREQQAALRMTGALQKSTEVMASVNNLIKVPEVAAIMRNMSKEMEKAGIIEEMMNDALDDVLDEDGLEEAADIEVDNVLTEILGDTFSKVSSAPDTKLPQVAQPQPQEQLLDDDDIASRMAALKN